MSAANPNPVVGTAKADVMFGGGRNDTVVGDAGNDRMHGGGGNDRMSGDAGNDTMFGDSGRGGVVDMTRFRVAEDAKGTVTFEGESAGYMNAFGVYKIAADGSIYDVDIIWANASLKDSGGDLVGGKSTESLSVKAGERLGFFVVPDGYNQKNMSKLLADAAASWKFVDAKGNPGNINAGGELTLVHVSPKGKETDIKSAYGTSVFHSVDDGSLGLNGDGLGHAVGKVDTATGRISIGFEDLKGGGDKDFDDSVVTVNLGTTNGALLPKVPTKVTGPRDDDMAGGAGDDTMFGMSGNDRMDGGDGNDAMWGNSGDDDMSGGAGDDHMRGGAGNDRLADGAGNDVVEGNSGDDVIVAGDGDDTYDGDAGFDTLDMSAAKNGVEVDLHAHKAGGLGSDTVTGIERVVGSDFDDTFKGDKNDNVLEGGKGDDVFRGLGGADRMAGGEGRDTFQWLAKDVVDAGGKHLGVDEITDFSKEDVLDFSKLLKGTVWSSIDEVVAIKDDGVDAHVYANLGGSWFEIVTLEGYTGYTAADLLHDGSLIV